MNWRIPTTDNKHSWWEHSWFVPSWWKGKERYLGALLGIALATVDIFFANRVGIHFDLGGTDITWAVLGFLAVSFGVFGFLSGYLLETRRAARRSEEAVRRHMADVEDLRRRLSQSERLAVVGQLAAGVAHEIRNPLAILRTNAQNLDEAIVEQLGLDSVLRAECQFQIAEIDRLTQVTASLLGLSRPLSAKQEPLPVSRVFDRVEQLAPPELQAKDIRLLREEAADLPPLAADESLVCQLLLDLLLNAVAATPQSGSIVLQAELAEDGRVELAIRDSGSGVEPELRERIFDPLFTTRESGHGLGLAIASQLAEALDARLRLDETWKNGARFEVSLPAMTGI